MSWHLDPKTGPHGKMKFRLTSYFLEKRLDDDCVSASAKISFVRSRSDNPGLWDIQSRLGEADVIEIKNGDGLNLFSFIRSRRICLPVGLEKSFRINRRAKRISFFIEVELGEGLVKVSLDEITLGFALMLYPDTVVKQE